LAAVVGVAEYLENSRYLVLAVVAAVVLENDTKQHWEQQLAV